MDTTYGRLKVEHYPVFKDITGQEYSLVDFKSPNKLLVWKKLKTTFGWNNEICMGLLVHKVSVDALKEMKIWDKLEEEVKIKVIEYGKNNIEQHRTYKGRKQKYPNMPEELICTVCKESKKVVKSQLGKMLESKGLELEGYVEAYQCRKCRSPLNDPKYAGLPTELICNECGKAVKQSSYALIKKIDRTGISIAEIIEAYKCQVCNPTRGKKANPKYANIPKNLICNKCEAVYICSPSQIYQRAKGKKMDVEEFIKEYVCQKCCPTRGRGRKRQKE